VDKVIRTSTSGTGSANRRRTQHYDAVYRFAVDGVTIEGQDELTREAWEQLTEGAQVNVLYLPADPGSNRLAGPRPWLLNVIFGSVGLLLTPIGAVLVGRALRRAALEKRLQSSGTSTNGTVTTLTEGSFRVNNEYMWRLEFEYRDSQGDRHVNALTLPPEAAQQWKVGDVGMVRYDPAKPGDAVWLGRS
jgi:hypothetical protein